MCSDLNQLACKSDKRSVYDFNTIALFESLRGNFDLSITVNQQTKYIYLLLRDRNRLTFK